MAKTRIDFISENKKAVEAYNNGNFKVYKGWDNKYSVKVDDEVCCRDVEFSEVERIFEDIYWDNFIFEYLRDEIGLDEWNVNRVLNGDEVVIENESADRNESGLLRDYVSYYLDCFKLYIKTSDGNNVRTEEIDFERIG